MIAIRTKHILLGILLVASFLRLWNLWAGDPLTDEVLYSFRAIDMLDFDEAEDQTTPLEWFDPFIPSWVKYSFHDHPPLVFFVQNIFINIFGETTLAFRLPSAILGIASVYLLYILGKYLYSEPTGLAAAALFALTANHVTISRLGIQESYVLFFILLASYLFLQSLKKDTYFIWTGLVLGLAFLTKYTAFILVPIFLTYLFIFQRSSFGKRNFWIGIVLSSIIFSPVLYYNFRMWQVVGHFDFQLSFLFRQNPEIWQSAPGKEEFATLASRIQNFFPNLLIFNSWTLLLAFSVSVGAFIYSLYTRGAEILRKHVFLILLFFYIATFIIFVIGPSFRFLAMLTPLFALGSGVLIASKLKLSGWIAKIKIYRLFIVALSLFLVFEFTYSVNSQLILYPHGEEMWAFSRLRYENYSWGYAELGKFLDRKLLKRMPALAFEQKYNFIQKIHIEKLARMERQNLDPYPVLFVYDKNINSLAQLWYLDRLQIYHAWPIITAESYIQFLQENGEEYFARSGFEEIYFIFPTENVPWKRESALTQTGAQLEKWLTESDMQPYTILQNKKKENTFKIFRI